MFNTLIYIIFFPFDLYYLRVCIKIPSRFVSFFVLKMEMGFLEKCKKLETRKGHVFYTTTVNLFIKIIPVHN